jgi:hypothetical protein
MGRINTPRPPPAATKSLYSGDKNMDSRLSIISKDGLFKVFEHDQPLRIKSKNGKVMPVEFETKEAAEGFVRAQELFRAFDQLEDEK